MRLVKVSVFGAALIALSSCSKPAAPIPPPPVEIDAMTLSPGEVRETGEYLGTIISRQTVNIVPQVGGYIREIHVKPGDRVAPGAALVAVDQRQESAAVDSAEAQVQAARTAVDLARQTLTRTQQLYDEGLVSTQELERAQASVQTAEAVRTSAGAAAAQRRVQLQYYSVRAPVGGTVGEVNARVGDFVTASTVLTSIAQADALEVSVGVPAERARSLAPDATVEILDSAGSVILTTTLYYIAPQADPRTQLVEVKAAFRNTASLRPSELVRTRIVYGVGRSLQVPALSVVRQSGQPFVYAVVERDGKTVVSRMPVTLGALGDTSYVLLSGLAAGDRIAASSLQALRDGATVHVRTLATAKPSATQEAVR